MKLNDEKKFFVNKNLFENASIPPLKPVSFNFSISSSTTNKENENKETHPKGKENLVE